MSPTRKRRIDNQEDEAEFVPLQKRINNLHINVPTPWHVHHHHPDAFLPTTASSSLSSPPPSASPSSVSPSRRLPTTVVGSRRGSPLRFFPPYNPALTEQENMYYYQSNKLLYEMHVARQGRTDDDPPP